jgi:predicted ATPase
MLTSIEFKNFRVLRDALLPLKPFTLILGPNGSGKSTALNSLWALQNPNRFSFDQLRPLGAPEARYVNLTAQFDSSHSGVSLVANWPNQGGLDWFARNNKTKGQEPSAFNSLREELTDLEVYALDSESIIAAEPLQPAVKLGRKGEKLAVVLDQLRDQWPERFEAINQELGRWLPEFDRILFDTPSNGKRAVKLRSKRSQGAVAANNLSQGTLQVLAILTIAYLPKPPKIIGIEEPDRGIHPRLLRQVRDALYRLSYPEEFGESRTPTQVIATTHSPYFLDLFRDRPEEVVLAEKLDDGARFIPLSSYEHLEEILRDTHLSEAWYSGILGGVPANS